jgi:predicted acylesterase/phospholipase RssA
MSSSPRSAASPDASPSSAPAGNASSSDNRIRIGSKRKIAFVCSGGAAKAGAFHLGVALALQEHGFKFRGGKATPGTPSPPPGPMEISTYVGSSAGSIISIYLAAGYTLENIFNSFLGRSSEDPIDRLPQPLPKLTYQKMFRLRPGLARENLEQVLTFRRIFSRLLQGEWEALIQFKWIKTSGIFSTAGIEQYLREEVLPSNRFEDYLAELFVVATQLNHSRKVVFGKYRYEPPPHDLSCEYESAVSISDACAASTALPFIFSPYAIASRDGTETQFIDGEIRDTLSSHVAIDAGADLVIASYTHQPYHYHSAIGSLTEHGLPAILIQSIYLLVEQKINNHIHNKTIQRSAIEAVMAYCRANGVAEEHREKIQRILEAELHHRLDVDTIYIHPKPEDSAMFFGEHFSLSPKRMTEIVRSGFRAAIDTLRRYEFTERATAPQPVDVGPLLSGRHSSQVEG